MSEVGLNALLEILKVVYIVKKCGFSRKMKIKKIFNMAQRNDISFNAVNKIQIR